MADTLSPFVYWGQDKSQITLKIELRDASSEVVKLTEDGLRFSAEGSGVRGHNYYSFDLDFYLPVDPEESKYRVVDRAVEFQIKKRGEGEVWPRLTEKKVKYPWLKIDFDKVAYDESDFDSEKEGETLEEDEDETLKRLEKELMKDVDAGSIMPDWKTAYLFVYNLFQFIGYMFIFCSLSFHFFKENEHAFYKTMKTAGTQMVVVQTVAFLEILHPLTGLVRSSPVPAMMQVLGRNFVLFLVILQEPRLQDRPIVFILFVVWSSIEVIRYPFYMLSVIGKKNSFITWLRYSAWIPLYPLGMVVEACILLAAIPLFEQTMSLSPQLPNFYNFSFYFPWFLKLYLFLFVPAGLFLLNTMYITRQKALGGRKGRQSRKKEN